MAVISPISLRDVKLELTETDKVPSAGNDDVKLSEKDKSL